jgi:glycosyltransferase involved in cell wall biosynthesis
MNPEWLSAQNVEGLGWVADADAEMATWTFTIVPVFEGGGTRVKISNAFSRLCPVVSTTLGAYGYEVTSGRELLIADSADDFTSSCRKMLEADGLAEQLAANAWQAFQENWSWDAIGKQVEEAVRFVLKRRVGGF